ncbi:hypothetical protein AB0O28_05015 [Microbispora sp. NPDC088329]
MGTLPTRTTARSSVLVGAGFPGLGMIALGFPPSRRTVAGRV